MKLLNSLILLIIAGFLSYAIVGGFNQKVPFKIEIIESKIKLINFLVSNIKLTSLDENLTLQNVIINKGECQNIFEKAKLFPVQLNKDKTIEFSTVESLTKPCKISQIEVKTNFGNWNLKY